MHFNEFLKGVIGISTLGHCVVRSSLFKGYSRTLVIKGVVITCATQ